MNMSDFPKKFDRGHFSDIKTARGSGVRHGLAWLKNHDTIVNLKPTFYKRRPIFIVLTALIAGGFAFWGMRQLFTQAEVADFFPSTCLGAWAGAQNAQGKPEVLAPASARATFGENNSAVFTSGTGQIFCGGFVPQEYATAGDIKNVGLTFVWQIGEPTATSSFPQGAEVSTGAAASSEIATTTPPTNETSTTSFLYHFRGLIFNTAFADAASDIAPVASDATAVAPTSETTTQAVIIALPITAILAPITSSTAEATSGTAPTSAPALASPAPDENFLEISYSVDGATWIEIAKVNKDNWQNFTVTLPIAGWDLLRKLQIQITDIPTTLNPTPKVYLDGMFAEVHYEIPPAFTNVIGGGSSEGPAPQAANGPAEVPAGTPVIVLPPSQKPVPAHPEQNTFKADEAPQFNLDLNSLAAPSSTAP